MFYRQFLTRFVPCMNPNPSLRLFPCSCTIPPSGTTLQRDGCSTQTLITLRMSVTTESSTTQATPPTSRLTSGETIVHTLTTLRPHFDHTSTKLRPPLNHPSTTLRPPFDHPSTTLWPPFDHTSTTLRPHFDHLSTTFRQPFDQPSNTLLPPFKHPSTTLQPPFKHLSNTLRPCTFLLILTTILLHPHFPGPSRLLTSTPSLERPATQQRQRPWRVSWWCHKAKMTSRILLSTSLVLT